MFIASILRRSGGVSYIQVLLASSVLAGLAVVGIKMMENQEKLAKLTSQKFEISYLINEMSHILKDPVNCKASFQGLNPSQSVRRINSLKKELRGGKFRESTYFLKYSTFSSSKNLYGQDNIKIDSYSLSDRDQDVNVLKGSTKLVVTFITDEDKDGEGKKIQKSIPLKVKTNEGGLVACELFNTLAEGGSSNSRKSLGLGLNLASETRGAVLAVDNGLTLIPIEGNFPDCDNLTVGTLIYMKKYDDLYICNEFGGWSTLGLIPTNTDNTTTYNVIARSLSSISEVTARHRLCIIQEFKSNESGDCLLSPSENTHFKTYKINASFSSPQGGQFCRVECFN